jgi:D-2-hydroxyacid dehydrogenase (NADP+)
MAHADPKILILLPWELSIRLVYENLLRARCSDVQVTTVANLDAARTAIVDADIFMCFGVNVTADIFANAQKLKWVHAFGTGVDGIVDQPGLRPDVIVTNTRGVHGTPLSEMVLLQMLALFRGFPRSLTSQKQRKWDRFRAKVIAGKRVGILGVGAIAEDLAPRLSALGMEVVGITRSARPLPGFVAMRPREPLAAAVSDLDVLVLLIPLEPATRNIIDAKVLAAMKPGS